jgi:hypothetical protein
MGSGALPAGGLSLPAAHNYIREESKARPLMGIGAENMTPLQYQWFLAIGAMAISGLAVALFSRWMIRLGDKTKEISDSTAADREIIQALRPYIAECGLPEIEIIDALISSTARRHGRNAEELNSVRIICEDLMREIMGNVYMPVGTKQAYTKRLSAYLKEEGARQKSRLATDVMREMARAEKIDRNFYRKKIIGFLGFALAATASLVSGAATLAITEVLGNSSAYVLLSAFASALVFSSVFAFTIAYASRLPLARKKRRSELAASDLEAEEEEEEGFDDEPPLKPIEYKANEPAEARIAQQAKKAANGEDAYLNWDSANVESIVPDSLGEEDFYDKATLGELLSENYSATANAKEGGLQEKPEKEAKPKKPRKKKPAAVEEEAAPSVLEMPGPEPGPEPEPEKAIEPPSEPAGNGTAAEAAEES